MRVSRPPLPLPTVLATLATLALAACADRAPTAPNPLRPGVAVSAKGTGGAQSFTVPVEFTIADGCVPGRTVTATGTEHVVVQVVPSPDGTFRVIDNEEAHGTATDGQGGRYVFNYAFAGRIVEATELGGIFTIEDHFNLLGQAGAPSMKVAFRETFDIGANQDISFVERGDAACDPI